jgi:hypothetical protein
MPAPPDFMGLSDEEIQEIDRSALIVVMVWWSPFFVYLALAMLNGWPI